MSPAVEALLAAGKDPKHPLYKAATKIQAQFRGHMVSVRCGWWHFARVFFGAAVVPQWGAQTCAHTHTHIHTHTHTHTHIHTRTSTHTHTHKHTHIHTYTHIHTHTHTDTDTDTHTHAHAQTHTFTHTHVHTQHPRTPAGALIASMGAERLTTTHIVGIGSPKMPLIL